MFLKMRLKMHPKNKRYAFINSKTQGERGTLEAYLQNMAPVLPCPKSL
jgi:hypothetical protein